MENGGTSALPPSPSVTELSVDHLQVVLRSSLSDGASDSRHVRGSGHEHIHVPGPIPRPYHDGGWLRRAGSSSLSKSAKLASISDCVRPAVMPPSTSRSWAVTN